MIDATILLLHFTFCGTQVCGGPHVAEKTFSSIIECRREVRSRLSQQENRKDIYACVLADRWTEPQPQGMPNIRKPFLKDGQP